jgi:hypothetical protein
MLQRHYGLDWLRIGAFALLILYHTGMYYVEWGWHVKASPTVDWVKWPMMAVNPWRMALLFMVSGVATRFLFAKAGSAGELWRARWPRILLPLLFGVAVVVPLQPWVELSTQHGYAHGFGHFLAHDYFRFGALDGIVLPTWNHLWFLAYLLAYTGLLAGMLALPGLRPERLDRLFDRLFAGWRLWGLPILWIMLIRLTLLPRFGETHALVDDWYLHALYLPIFLFGFSLAASLVMQRRLAAVWKPLLAFSLVALCVRLALIAAFPQGWDSLPEPLQAVAILARSVQVWTMLAGLTGLALDRLNRDHPWRKPLADAVFPAYIVHQTAIVAIAFWTAPLGWPLGLQAVVIVAGTLLACWAAWAVGRRLGPAAVLLGTRPVAARAPVAA